MNDRILASLEQWLAAGKTRFGQLAISGCELCHHEDLSREDLELFTKPEAARLIASLDDAGQYRPLKSAPNLRHGWKLVLNDLGEVKLALDFFYPAMLGTLLAWQEQRLVATNFRETANRQSGMYAVVKQLGNTQIDELIGNTCRHDTKCLKRILWQIDTDRPITTLSTEKFPGSTSPTELPLICCEACNLLIAAGRQVVKQSGQ